MKMLSAATMAIAALACTLTLSSFNAEAAKRLGGGKSVGMQKQASVPDKSPAAAPSAAPAASTAAAPAGAAAAAAKAPGSRSWMGPIAGLAAGLGIAALASHFGFGEELASMMTMALIAFAVIAVIGYFMRRKALANGAAGPGNLRYATASAEPTSMQRNAFETQLPGGSNAPAGAATVSGVSSTSSSARIPADFDSAGFARNAKINFIRLQAANDAGNLDDIREFTSPEMFAEIKLTLDERGGAKQTTDVVSINAEVLEVADEATRYVVSVRFTGLVREEQEANPEPIDEIWHLTKPREGKGGWVLAGIQQLN